MTISLTKREIQIMDLYIAPGYGATKAIAKELDLATRTVEIHLKNIRRKLQVPRDGAMRIQTALIYYKLKQAANGSGQSEEETESEDRRPISQ